MKHLGVLLILLGFTQLVAAQVGIGTTTPDAGVMLDVRGTVQIKDGTQGADKVLVSDADGKGTWEDVNGGVKTRVIRSLDVINPILWSHPAGIDVKFDTGTETVIVENNTGDAIDIWDIIIEGDARTASGNEGFDHYIKNSIVHGEMLSFDLGDINSGWFRIIASDHSDEEDGFIINIVYRTRFFNGTVQYWDEE